MLSACREELLEKVDGVSDSCSRKVHMATKTLRLENYSSTIKTVTVLPVSPIANAAADDDGHERLGHGEESVRVLLNFGEHGRELITSEIALFFLQTLCNDTLREEFLNSMDIDPFKVNYVLDKSMLVVVPMENLHGREMVEGGSLCERKNGRGVDPNRNWDIHWGHKEKDYDPSEEYPGSRPFSEPESELLRQLGSELKPQVWLNVHSGMEAMFLPYDHKNEMVKGPSAEATLKILNVLNERLCNGQCAVGPGGKTVGYLAHGTATDYMHEKLDVGISMTWEVYGKENVAYDNCFEMFNPLKKKEFDDVIRRWTGALYLFIASLPGHPAIPTLQTSASSDDLGDDGAFGEHVHLDVEKRTATLGRKGGRPFTVPTLSSGNSMTRLELNMKTKEEDLALKGPPLNLYDAPWAGFSLRPLIALGVFALLLLLSWKGLKERRVFGRMQLTGKRRVDKPLR